MMGTILVFGDCGEKALKKVCEQILSPFQVYNQSQVLTCTFEILFLFFIHVYLYVIKDYNVWSLRVLKNEFEIVTSAIILWVIFSTLSKCFHSAVPAIPIPRP